MRRVEHTTIIRKITEALSRCAEGPLSATPEGAFAFGFFLEIRLLSVPDFHAIHDHSESFLRVFGS